jgi:hypothetical protein
VINTVTISPRTQKDLMAWLGPFKSTVLSLCDADLAITTSRIGKLHHGLVAGRIPVPLSGHFALHPSYQYPTTRNRVTKTRTP